MTRIKLCLFSTFWTAVVVFDYWSNWVTWPSRHKIPRRTHWNWDVVCCVYLLISNSLGHVSAKNWQNWI